MGRVLVVYASRFGSTEEVAKRIAAILRQERVETDVRPIAEATSLHGYDSVVVGSLIREGKWVPEAFRFIEQHRAELREMPVAYFTVCMTLREDTPENREIVRRYHDPLVNDYADIRPFSIGMFAGQIDLARLPLRLRLLSKVQRIPDGDFRNWKRIERWARELAPVLRAQTVRDY